MHRHVLSMSVRWKSLTIGMCLNVCALRTFTHASPSPHLPKSTVCDAHIEASNPTICRNASDAHPEAAALITPAVSPAGYMHIINHNHTYPQTCTYARTQTPRTHRHIRISQRFVINHCIIQCGWPMAVLARPIPFDFLPLQIGCML